MDHEEAFFSGYVLLPPLTKILIKKTWQQKYCLLYKASKFGIERLELYDSADTTTKGLQPRIITLENCIKITPKSPTYFVITTKTAVYEFGTLTEQLLDEWVRAIQTVAFPDDVSKLTSIEENNDLYCSSGEGVFNVTLHHSPASQRCGLDHNKTYTLILTSTALQLRQHDNKLLYTWPYCFIRRYGYKSGKFTFEAGRKCESGEGIFFLEHSNQQEIFRCLASKMKSMRKLLNGESSPFPVLEGEFHAALSMEARSRTPLPPSSTSNSIQDLSAKQLNNSIENEFLRLTNNNNEKVKPAKPPRKFIGHQGKVLEHSSSNSSIDTDKSNQESIDKYECVQYRNNAWRTLGVNDIKHTEQILNDIEAHDEDDIDYMSWGQVVPVKIPKKPVPAPKIITSTTQNTNNSYDKLNFFGSSSKLNYKSDYKQVIPAPCVQPPSFNDYDEVQPWKGDDIRPADESKGYALVRKENLKENTNHLFIKSKGLPSNSKDDEVNHQFHNNEPYAVISKPKRV